MMLSRDAGQRHWAACTPSRPSNHDGYYTVCVLGCQHFWDFVFFSHPIISTKMPICVSCFWREEKEGNYCWDEQDDCSAIDQCKCSEPVSGRLGYDIPQVRCVFNALQLTGVLSGQTPIVKSRSICISYSRDAAAQAAGYRSLRFPNIRSYYRFNLGFLSDPVSFQGINLGHKFKYSFKGQMIQYNSRTKMVC